MIILVDNREALIKSGSSFDFVAENRLFLGRDSYTLNITFPLADCPQNCEIFGHIDRVDTSKPSRIYECSIQDGGMSVNGVLRITSVTNDSVTAQFAEGRCRQTATDPFENTYVNELDLGSFKQPVASRVSPAEAWQINSTPEQLTLDAVALPWINNSYPDPPNNDAVYDSETGTYRWADDTTNLSWQPYLLAIAKRICAAVGYGCDFSAWEASNFRYLIICNTLPASWDIYEYARALPHWTVSEFFEKLELFLLGEFSFDHRSRFVSFQFSRDALDAIPEVEIDNVVDSYSVELANDSDTNCDYLGAKRLAFKERDDVIWAYQSCDWFFATSPAPPISFSKFIDLYNRYKPRLVVAPAVSPTKPGQSVPELSLPFCDPPLGADGNPLFRQGYIRGVFYAEDIDTSFVLRSIDVYSCSYGDSVKYDGKLLTGWHTQKYALTPVNTFGSGSPESDDVDTTEIEFIPPCIMDTDEPHGDMMFLSPSGFSENSDATGPNDAETTPDDDRTHFRQNLPAATLEAGEPQELSEYYDSIYVGFWNGTLPVPGKMPFPVLDRVVITSEWELAITPFADMRLTSPARSAASQLPKIDPAQKFKFSFLSSSVPNPRAVFHISGKRYVCEKITATFTENGMSQLLKGEFYPIADD